MENINESRNSISIYIQSFTQHMLLKKNTLEFCMTIPVMRFNLVKMSRQKIEKIKIKILTF